MEQRPNRKPGADFLVRLVAPGLKPWLVPMRTLARICEATQRLVEQSDDGAEDDRALSKFLPHGKDPSSALRLISVTSSSAGYQVAAPRHEGAVNVIRQLGRSINDPVDVNWSAGALSSIQELTDVAKSLGCEIEFREPGSGKVLGPVIAKISPSTYSEISEMAFVFGPTSIFGKIERVGGATEMHCGVHISGQPRMVICRVASEDLVRQLGQYMYQEVMLSGQATWLRQSWQIKHFEITGFEPPKVGSIRDALRRIHEAGGSAWDKVADPDDFIREMRGG